MSIRNLSPPFPQEDRNNRGDSDDDTVSSWDSTYQRQLGEPNTAQHHQLCSHAVSIGHHVFGIIDPNHDVDTTFSDQGNDDHWWNWQRSLLDVNKPMLSNETAKYGTINALRSNCSGTVIAVASDTGVVSLLRGCDGQILATRRVGMNSSNTYAIRLAWISGSTMEQSNDNYTDVLLIEVPTTEEESNSSNSQLILVANINGRKLNDTDPNIVTEAVHNTQIIPINMHSTTNYDLRAFAASRTGTLCEAMRFVSCDADSHLVIFDFDRVGHDLKLIQDRVALKLDSSSFESKQDYTIDFELGFHEQIIPNECLMVCSAFIDPTAPMIVWFSPRASQAVCVYTVPQLKSQHHPPASSKFRKGTTTLLSTTSKVIAMEAITSWNSSETMAIAIAVKSIQKSGIVNVSSITNIHVVQISLDDTFGLISFGRPHLVYLIPIEESVMSLQIASFGCHEQSVPYSFRYQVWTDSKTNTNCVYKAFQPHRTIGTGIGKLRSSIYSNNFQEADKVIKRIGLMSLTMESYADFHPSEIVLHRLQHTVTKSSYDDNTVGLIDEIKLCLREMVHGVILQSGNSGKTLGFDIFVQSIDFLTEKVSTTNMTLETFHQCLLQIASAIESVLPNLDNSIHTEKLELHRHDILERVAVLDFLSTSSSQQNVLVPFYCIRSLPHLYEIFIQEQQYGMAESTFRSNRKSSCWNSAALAKPLLQYVTDALVAPKEYIFLLQDVIFINLSVNDGMVSRLKSWSCRIADALDDKNIENRDLNAAILLLKVMDAGIRKLQVQIHGSFASYSPFPCNSIETRNPMHRRPSPKTNASEEELSSDMHKTTFSFGGQLPSKITKNNQGPSSFRHGPIPTILQRGALQRGPTSSNSATVKSYTSGDDDSFQEKLLHAQCIKEARDLGLGREIVSLHDFVSYGGKKRISRDLIRLLCASVETHDSRKQLLNEQFKPFCSRYLVESDDVMYDCVVDICRNKNVDIHSIEACCSITRCCSSPNIRCQNTLTILQAALNCGCTCASLFALSKEAMNDWAPRDTNIRAELQEALRLLQIDDIIVRYCGSDARELFRVSNPFHASNLLDFLTQQIEHDTIIDDVISLCDAFNHLCACEATGRVIENSFLQSDSKRCLILFEKLVTKNDHFAEQALANAITYAEIILTECSYSIRMDLHGTKGDLYKQRALRVCATIVELLRFALKRPLNLSFSKCRPILCASVDISLPHLLSIFLRIQRLQKEYAVYVSMAEMFQPNDLISTILPFLERTAKKYSRSDFFRGKNELSVARTICSLLSLRSKAEDRDIWVTASTLTAIKMVKDGNYHTVLHFLCDTGVLKDMSNRLHTVCQVIVAGVLCEEHRQSISSAMNAIQPFLFASALLTNWSISTVRVEDLMLVLEVAGHLDVACQILSRCDEGVGESVEKIRNNLRHQSREASLSCNSEELKLFECSIHKADIHSSWYIGDGILLPPEQSLKYIALFLNEQMRKDNFSYNGSIELYDLLVSSGAHSLAFRILCVSASIIVSIQHHQLTDRLTVSIRDSIDDTMHLLLERNLGGTGSGITNCIIDSQQSVIFLLSRSPKQAFAVYKSCLPTSMKMQNFERLQILSSIGMVASGGDAIGWNNQHKFFSQCQQLAIKAKWWNIIQFYGIEFDSQLFCDYDEANGIDSTTECKAKYASSLLPSIVANASKFHDSLQVLHLALKYSEIFDLPTSQVASAILEYVLLRPDKISEKSERIYQVEDILRRSLECLTPSARCKCLRRCLMKLERSVSFQGDYESINMLLCLYYECLSFHMDNEHPIQCALLETELYSIERRRDVLAILAATFQGDKASFRPKFSSFFLPLPEVLGHTSITRNCGVLGRILPEEFDPLEPLERYFSAAYELGVVTALAPLCNPLLIPNGYVHARSLMARFNQARKGEMEFPSFNNDVITVLNKLTSPSDRAALAEWCTNQYDKYDDYKLNCLSEFLNATIAASTEIEHRRRHFPNDEILKQQESDFLERIRSIALAKSTMSDFLRTTNLLRSHITSVPKPLGHIINCLIAELEKTMQGIPAITPEELVDFLFANGSYLTSGICVEGETSFPIDYFRQCCSIIHSACCDISNHYSHVDVTDRARRLAHQWLFFGDDSAPIALHHARTDQTQLRDCDHIDDESTVNFVMDISAISSRKYDGFHQPAKVYVDCKDSSRTNLFEERSALHVCTSREFSEVACQRSALRIAFVLAFSATNHKKTNDELAMKENIDSNHSALHVNSTSKRLGLLAQVQTKRVIQDDNNVYDLGLELLGIVFAKSGSSSNLLQRFQPNSSLSSTHGSMTKIPSTITFAMRHRALRAAAILCPQEVLEEIVRNEGMLTPSNNFEQLSLRQCSYGSFLAKEIEEIGLPLPHSDLLQLSSMNFSSYARSLWRDHRDDKILEQYKGRFYLLLIELCLQKDHADPTFVGQLLDEMVRRNQQRSLLKALEQVIDYETRVKEPILPVGSVNKSISAVADAIFSDLKRALTNRQELLDRRRTDMINTLNRFNTIILSSFDANIAIAYYNKLIDLLKSVTDEPTTEELLAMTTQFRERAERYSGGKLF